MQEQKIKILFMSDWCDTGFGTVSKEICARLADMEVFEVHVIGWHSQPANIPEAAANKIQLHTTQFWNAADQFGLHTYSAYVEKIRPQVVITLGDPWMVDHVSNDPLREDYTWIAYMPIDRDVISRSWRRMMKKPDVLVLYSEFGRQIVNESIPFRNARVILHGVDRMVFKPWYPEGTDEDTPHDELMEKRKEMTLGSNFSGNPFIVGWVGRNQVRKAMPRTIRAFKAFNCATWTDRQRVDVRGDDGEIEKSYTAEEFCRTKQCFRCDICPAFQQREETLNSRIYLHTTRGNTDDGQDRPGIGWLVDELAERHKLHGRVGMTPGLRAIKGLPRAALAQIMNCFDVHLFLSHSEGFGLPIAESLACGVPTLVTDYSSMPELVEQGGGVKIRPIDFYTFTTYENELANADIGDAADEVNRIFEDQQYAVEMRRAAAANKYVPDWNQVAMQFRDLIMEAVGMKGL